MLLFRKSRWGKVNNIVIVALFLFIVIAIFNIKYIDSLINTVRLIEPLMDEINPGEKFPIAIGKIKPILGRKELTSRQIAIINGEEKPKRLHRLFPENKVYLANYIKHLSYGEILKQDDYDALSKEHKEFDFEDHIATLKIIEMAEKKEPENAYYNYCKSFAYLTQALVIKKHKQKIDGLKIHKKRLKGVCEPFAKKERQYYTIINNDNLKKALAEYKKGLKKPYLKNYILEYEQERLRLQYDKITTFEQQLDKITMDAGMQLQNLGKMREIIRAVAFSASIEYNKGNIAETEALFATWQPFLKQFTSSSNELIAILVNVACGAIFFSNANDFYNQIGDIKQRDYFNNKYKRIDECHNNIKNSFVRYGDNEEFKKQVGIMNTMLSGIREKGETDAGFMAKLAPERMIWYKIMEQLTIAWYAILSVVYGLILWLGAFFVKLNLRRYKGFLNMPIIIKPTFKEILQIVVIAVIIPFTIYFTITNIDALSGRKYFIIENALPIMMQLNLLLLTILYPTFFAVSLIVRKRCMKNNIVVPRFWSIYLIVNSTLYLSFVLYSLAYFYKIFPQERYIWSMSYFLQIMAWIFSLLALFYVIRLWFKKNIYRQLVVVNSLPYFIVISLAMTLTCFYTFRFQQNYYFNKDETLAKEFGVLSTVKEHKLVQQSKKFLLDKVILEQP